MAVYLTPKYLRVHMQATLYQEIFDSFEIFCGICSLPQTRRTENLPPSSFPTLADFVFHALLFSVSSLAAHPTRLTFGLMFFINSDIADLLKNNALVKPAV